MNRLGILLVTSMIAISACSSMATAEKNDKCDVLNDTAAKTNAGLKEKESNLQQKS